MWWAAQNKDCCVSIGNAKFWPEVLTSVELAGAVAFMMAHKEPFMRKYEEINFSERTNSKVCVAKQS